MQCGIAQTATGQPSQSFLCVSGKKLWLISSGGQDGVSSVPDSVPKGYQDLDLVSNTSICSLPWLKELARMLHSIALFPRLQEYSRKATGLASLIYFAPDVACPYTI